jgi:DNA polymerase III delta prime subunit
MHNSLHISAYTPSNTDPEILEKMFVQRHRLLEKTVAWCEESITTSKKNHLLFVGPRGSGKTHFISMVVNRLRAKPVLQEKMIILWLGEDDVITSLVDLLLLMIENLVKTDPERFDKDCLKQAIGQKPDTVADIIMHSINEQIGSLTILLLKENLSDVFSGLKDTGQKKLRAYLQENKNIAILATSQQLFHGISSRDAAFFGFFDTYHLKVLSVEDAKQLISNIAALNNNQQLVDFLKTPQGCYRVRALHHLAGGNHRLYVELAAFLTMESLDDFVSALTKLADSLTPYFQERVKSLPAQQGRIIQKLCEMQGATPVKTIAEQSFIGERSVAKQLGDLAKKGYVISHKRGKQSYYEIAEPLMRVVLEVKNNQGKPLKMVASLLSAWFSNLELQAVKKNKDNLMSDYKEVVYSIDKAHQTLVKMLEQGDKGNNEHYSLNTDNTLRSIILLGSSFWQKQITWILALYAKHGVLDDLGSALIYSISFFVEDESLTSSLRKWQQLWQQYAEKHQEMLVPLQILQAAVLAIEQKNDKPLFSLPKEVRELVLPLLAGRLN